MKCWYFKFEGKFQEGSPKYGYEGVFSSSLVPQNNYRKAKSIFLQALKDNKIELVEILEYFAVDDEELDPEDGQNTFWIKWCKQAKKRGDIVFDKWHVFND